MDTLIIADRIIDDGPVADTEGCAAVGVLVRDEQIQAVGPAAEVRAQVWPDTAELVFPGASVMPGLINSHVHLCGDLSAQPFSTVESGDRTAIERVMRQNARSALRGGCTTVRDLGDKFGIAFKLRDQISAGEIEGPRILAAGSPLTIPKGHCWFLGGEVADRDAIDRHIAELSASGADLVKVMAGGGQMTPSGPTMYESQFAPEGLQFIVERASVHQLPVAAHAHGTKTIGECVEAGVRTIEHCSWWARRGEIALDDGIAERMAEDNIAAGDTTPPQWRMLADLMPFPEGFRLGDQLPWLRSHGVPILVGTDSGLPNAVFDDFPTSLELYQERGFSSAQVIGLASWSAADHLGLANETGRLRAGLAADLLVVPGDPASDLAALRQPQMVMARGRRVDLHPEA